MSELSSDLRAGIIAACERVDAAAAKADQGQVVPVPALIESARILAESFRLLAPEWFSPKVDARQQGLFVAPPADGV